MSGYVCSNCGAGAYYDGRMGDGPVLVCGCDKRGSRFVQDRCGGHQTNPSGAHPVEGEAYNYDEGAYDDGRH